MQRLPCIADYDNCMNHKCVKGTCQDGQDSYTCACNSGWTGQYCDTGKLSPRSLFSLKNTKQTAPQKYLSTEKLPS